MALNNRGDNMKIQVNNLLFTSRNLMIILSFVSLLITLYLSYLKIFTESEINSNNIVFAIILTALNIYLINK
ncbi:hypothetical protein SV13_14860 [Clostridium perfringens]|uniref:Uncharacterized protein n=3 Tax=Clostridium TaxID=1485 RepID=A0A140GPQ7_CLOPF|nr:hypothetical protein [Clostridium tertium]AMN30516.1 hypothetical protein JFP838_pE0010 [Clostridium perfringens]EDS80731.1 conserved hypothetical protein [Clostridium perfringens C str. JGS1495]AMN30909.1 hypothetical protein JFP55_pK0010 [Clostridium perfringens]EGT3601508.1 hypothetical protein [Clostridium perfringens]KAF2782577.1 hypothetical protein SV13_14860 [Clostridium perfringens]